MTRPDPRSGYTLLELLCVIAVLVILGAVILPTINGLNRDTRVAAAGDMVRGWCSEARSRAIDEGRMYQLSASPDGRQLRIGPDESELLEAPAGGQAPRPMNRVDMLPDAVTLVPTLLGSEQAVTVDGWTRLATFRPDGTCTETSVVFELQEPGVTSRVVTIRGLTGGVTVNVAAQTGGR